MFDSNRLESLGLRIDPNHHALICLTCRLALPVTGSCLTSHLWDKHKIPKESRAGLTSYVHSLHIVDPPDLPVLPHGSVAHPDLKVFRIYACKACGQKSTSQDVIGRHLSKRHKRSQQVLDKHTDIMLCQSWTSCLSSRQWTVQDTATVTCPSPLPSTSCVKEIHAEETTMIARHERLRAFDPSDTGLAVPELTSPWMNRTRWPEIYRDCRRDILVRLTEVGPRWLHSRDVRLGRHDDVDLSSLARNEKKIWILLQAVDDALDRCEETMRCTGRPILCWLASTKSNEFCPRPFTFLSRRASRQRYRRLWKKFIAFAFRLYHLPAATRQSAFGIKLSDDQLAWLGEVWDDRCWNVVGLDGGPVDRVEGDEEDCDASDDEESEDEEEPNQEQDDAILESDDEMEAQRDGRSDDVDGVRERRRLQSLHVDLQSEVRVVDLHRADISTKQARDRISELIFRLSIFFAAEKFTDGQPHSSLLVYYAGILGLSVDGRTFRRAKDYTPQLSGLIYIQRLLFLEVALPHKAYENITISQRPQSAHLERLDEVRMRYMVSGCLSPFGEFQSLRDYGQVIARSDPPAFMFRWSEDYQTIHYGDDSLSMEQLRSFASKIVSSAAMLCARLMYDWQPEFDLHSIKDDFCNLQEGYSFIDHPSNELSSAYLELSTRACTDASNGLLVNDQWNTTAVWRYLKLEEELLELLLAMFHILGGQAPRGTEILSLECRNGPSTERGIYVHEGSIIYVTKHHKARKITNREFYVVRYLPNQAGRILFLYLVYIRPFAEMIQRRANLSNKGVSSRLLFRTFQAPTQLWSSQQLSTVLQKAGQGIFRKPFGVQLYRHISIGITERHVKRVAEPFNRHDDKSVAADVNVVFAWQSGHRPLQRSATYGLDGAFPTKLQPALLRVYKWASYEWHDFLRLGSSRSTAVRAMPPRAPKTNSGNAITKTTTTIQEVTTREMHGRSAQETLHKRACPPYEPEFVQQSKRQCISRSSQIVRTDRSQSLNAYINHLASEWPEGAIKWLTWDGSDGGVLPADRLRSLMSKWAQRCNLCHFQKPSKNVQSCGHSIANCKEYGAAWIRQQEKNFASFLERHVDNSSARFCTDCCLPGEWHLASQTREKVMRRGLFGPTCIFEGILAEAVAIMLSNNSLLEIVQDWKEKEAETDIPQSFIRMDAWMTSAVHWS